MSLHLKTKFCIAKPWSNIQSFRRFHFDLWQTSKQIYRKLQCSSKDIQGLTRFPRKMVLYSSTTLGIIKPSTNIPWLRWFDLGFSQTSKQIFRKLQLREEIFGELQGLLHFPRKTVLYFLTEFAIKNHRNTIQQHRRLNLRLGQSS